MKTLFSGIQPSGALHPGNDLGAVAVRVGQEQIQHIELTRWLARSFQKRGPWR